jgi:hypothetical protein
MIDPGVESLCADGSVFDRVIVPVALSREFYCKVRDLGFLEKTYL